MFSRFFIDRPIFASVLSLIITLAGGVAVFTLPIAQYPDIVPPQVSVTTTYPGASAAVVEATVAQPIDPILRIRVIRRPIVTLAEQPHGQYRYERAR